MHLTLVGVQALHVCVCVLQACVRPSKAASVDLALRTQPTTTPEAMAGRPRSYTQGEAQRRHRLPGIPLGLQPSCHTSRNMLPHIPPATILTNDRSAPNIRTDALAYAPRSLHSTLRIDSHPLFPISWPPSSPLLQFVHGPTTNLSNASQFDGWREAFSECAAMDVAAVCVAEAVVAAVTAASDPSAE